MECYFGRGASCSDKISQEYLMVNNCGYYKNIDTAISVCRMQGRSDYQIIYMESGWGKFLVNGNMVNVNEGSVVIYRPYEKQIYSIDKEAQASFYWIHFTGTGAEGLLKKLKLEEAAYCTGHIYAFSNIVEKMISACGVEDFTTDTYLTGSLITILSEVSKSLYASDVSIGKVIDAMRNDSKNILTNQDYANICGVSEYYFIRKFRKCMGVTPHAYKTKMMVEKAADLLQKTELNITEVANLLGFEDSLYFSRVFKKETGMSPQKFRKSDNYIQPGTDLGTSRG